MTRYVRLLALLLVLASLLAACGGATTTTTDTGSAGATATGAGSAGATATGAGSAGATATGASPAGGATTIILGAYTTPREAYGKLIPIFKAQWKQQTGQDLTFQESYQGSGAQSRAIVEGFEADVAALSLEADIDRIVKAGLITHDWKAGTYKGMVSDSVVAFAVRKGNPKGIKDWADLAKPGVQVLTPQRVSLDTWRWTGRHPLV